jgi:hypothetical protein
MKHWGVNYVQVYKHEIGIVVLVVIYGGYIMDLWSWL